jgi:hypothetical protein
VGALCDARVIQRQSSWCAGLSGLSRSSNQTNEIDQRNQMNQLPATCRELARVIHSRLSVSSEVQGQELTPVFYSGFLGNYAQTVTRKKVAGMEVVSLFGLLFWLLNRTSSSFCKSPARPFFSAASNAFMVGP